MIGVILVGAGSFIGGVLRYGLATWIHKFFGNSVFPLGTLAVNVSGCLVIGFLVGLAEARSYFNPEMRLFILVGILGGFTTYSSFGLETFYLARFGQFPAAIANVGLQLLLGMLAVWAGHFVGYASGR
jgi:fluoride exporter